MPACTHERVRAVRAGPRLCRYVVVDTCALNGIDFSRTTENADLAMYKQTQGRDELSRVVVDTQTGKV